MNLSKVSRNDWIVVVGFVLMLIGLSIKWYGASVTLYGVSIGGSVNGWHFFVTGIIPWLLTLIAALIVLIKAVPDLKFSLPFPEALSIMGLGGVAFVLVLIRLIDAPGSGLGRGVGLFIALIAAAIVAVGGFLKNSESAS
jgi:hypothetical protein